MEITLFIRGQKLEAHYPPLYSGSVGVLYARFAEIDFDKTLVKAVRFKTADSDWYTADITDGAVRVPHEVIVSGGFDIALAGYENEDGKLARFLPTNSVHINVEENGYGDPDAPIESEGEPASYTAKIEKLTSDAAAKADAAMTELEKKANAAEVYDKDTADALLGGKVDKVSGKGLSANDYTDGEKARLAAKADLSFVKKLIPKATVRGSAVTLTDHVEDVAAINYRIYGNSIREGDNSSKIMSVGDLITDEGDEHFGKYKIQLICEPKNLVNIAGRTVVSNWAFADTSQRVLTGNQIIRGYAASNYAIPVNVTISEVTDESISIVSQSNAYGVGLDVEICPNTEYHISGNSGNIGRIMVGLYDKDGNFLKTLGGIDNFTFTTPENAKWAVLALTATATTEGSVGSPITFSEIQLERGSTKTEYECGNGTEKVCIYADAPLRKAGDCADYVDFETQQLVRHTSEDGLGILDAPTIEPVEAKALTTRKSKNIYISVSNNVKGDIELTYYQDIGKKFAELTA